jgi:hypothetical protein
MSDQLSSRRLATALRELGLEALSLRADRDEFNDYFSQHEFPLLKLVAELSGPKIKHKYGVQRLIERIKQGEFDGTPEEAEEWAQSPEGQDTFRRLLEGK